jgi:ribosome-associated protein
MSEVDEKLDDRLKALGEEVKDPENGPKNPDSGLLAPDPTPKARMIVEAALDMKADRPIALDMRTLTSYADSFIVLNGGSDRQVRSIAESIIQTLKAQGDAPLGVEGLDDGKWVLIDCNEAVAHVFDPDTRIQFDLERLWRDAPRLDLGIEGVDPNPSPPTDISDDEDLADPAG